MPKKEEKNKKKLPLWAKIVIGVVATILVVGIAVFLRYSTALNGFLDKITTWGKETKEYSILVMDKSEFHELADLKNNGIGFLKTDPNSGTAEQYLQKQVEFETSFYDDIDTLMDVERNNVVSAITMESSRLEAMRDEVEDSVNDLRVIYTFEIVIENEANSSTNKEITTEPFIVYISGSDSREGITGVGRSDVNIVAVVNPKAGKILLVSIPRDTYVQLHGTTGLRDKLSHSGVYGIDMSRSTIEDFLDIKVDNTIKVSFETVVKLVDQLDGIEIDSDKAMTLKVEGKEKYCNYVEGKQVLDGDCALRFARERKSYNTGDRHRGLNQLQVTTSIIGKLSSSRNYLLKIPTILDIASDSFETDLSREDIMAFVRMQISDKINWKVESIDVDGAGTMEPTYTMGEDLPLYVMIPFDESLNEIHDKINEYLVNE